VGQQGAPGGYSDEPPVEMDERLRAAAAREQAELRPLKPRAEAEQALRPTLPPD
jgi:hypothetical protein